MKILLYTTVALLFSMGVLLVVLSIASRKQPELGLLNNQLRVCPSTPNCVCSEGLIETSFVEPLSYSIAHAAAWDSVKQAVVATGGVVVSERDAYLHARYVTPMLRYVDDVELRMDEDKHVIHIRSASRVGYSDLGTNRQRVERIREMFAGVAGVR